MTLLEIMFLIIGCFLVPYLTWGLIYLIWWLYGDKKTATKFINDYFEKYKKY